MEWIFSCCESTFWSVPTEMWGTRFETCGEKYEHKSRVLTFAIFAMLPDCWRSFLLLIIMREQIWVVPGTLELMFEWNEVPNQYISFLDYFITIDLAIMYASCRCGTLYPLSQLGQFRSFSPLLPEIIPLRLMLVTWQVETSKVDSPIIMAKSVWLSEKQRSRMISKW